MRVNQSVMLGLLLLILGNALLPGVNHAARLDTDSQAGKANAPGDNVTVDINFQDADLIQIIKLMSELTKKNFLIDEKVKGKITIVSQKPVSLDEAYQVFLSILEIQGFCRGRAGLHY